MKKTLQFKDHYFEDIPAHLKKIESNKILNHNHKTNLWNEFYDSGFEDILEADCSIYPRILPGEYLSVIQNTSFQITDMIMKLICLPEKEIRSIFPEGPIRNFLLDELKVIKHRPNRIVGSLRFDMAIVGEPTIYNPPKLLEINEIGFDGLARMPFIHDTLFKILPELKKKYFALNTSRAEILNMRRLGKSLARFQTDCYNWDEVCLLNRAKELKYDLRLITPKNYKLNPSVEDYPLLSEEEIKVMGNKIKIGKDWCPDSYMVSFALGIKDYQKQKNFYSSLVSNQVPHYGPFITGLFASKSILTILADTSLRRKLLGSSLRLEDSILPAYMLSDVKDEVLKAPEKFVVKHVDGFGGEQVFMDKDLIRTIKKLPQKKLGEWMIQKRINFNTIPVDGILSKPKKAIADLGVFVQYDYSNGKFNHFEVGGFLSRATNTSLKVNVSSGGAQVGVLFKK